MQIDRPAALRKASELTGFTIHDAGNFTNEQVQQFLIGLTQDTSGSNARLVRSFRNRKLAVDYGASQIEHIVIGHGIGDGDNWRLVGSGKKVKDYINKVVPKGKTAWCVVCSDSDPKRVGIVQGVAIVSKGNQIAQTEKNLSPQILARLDFLEQFKPSSEVPSPSFSPNGVAMDDFVYVLMGRKPAGYLNVPRLEEQSGMKLAELKALMESQGLVVAEVPNSPENIFFGVEANVKEALKLWSEVPSGSRKNNPDYHQRLGRIFGYPEEAIDAFLRKDTESISSPPKTPFKSPTERIQDAFIKDLQTELDYYKALHEYLVAYDVKPKSPSDHTPEKVQQEIKDLEAQIANFASSHKGDSKNLFWQMIKTLHQNIRGANYSKNNSKDDNGIGSITETSSSEIKVKPQNSWHFREGRNSKIGEIKKRISLNVHASPDLIKVLDDLAIKHNFYYKTPDSYSGWLERHDPVTLYFDTETIPKALFDELVPAVNQYIRSPEDVLVGKKIAPGIAEEESLSVKELEALIQKAATIDPAFGEAVREHFTSTDTQYDPVTKQPVSTKSIKASAGYVTAVRRIIEKLESGGDLFDLMADSKQIQKTLEIKKAIFNHPSLVEARLKLANEKVDEVLKNDLAARYYGRPLSADLPENPYAKSLNYSAYDNLGLPQGAKGSNRDTLERGWKPNQEWKLRLNVTPENAKAVSDYLIKEDYTYKFFRGGDLEHGEVFTIYIGSYSKASQEAQKLSANLLQFLSKPGELGDIEFAPGVTGRFREKGGGFENHGYYGFSALGKDQRNIVHKNKHKKENLPPDEYLQWKNKHQLNVARNAFIELYKKYGDYFYPLGVSN